MNLTKFLIAISILFLSNLNAQENLDSLLKNAAKNNPGLKSSYNKYLAALQKAPQIGSFPDPDVSFGYFIQPMELIGGNQTAQIQVMQMFPWFGTLKASKDEASQMALSLFELFNAEKQEIFYTVRSNYYQIYLSNKEMQVYDTAWVLLKSIEQLLLSKLKTVNSGNTNQGNKNINSTQEDKKDGMNTIQPMNQSGNVSMNNSSMGASSSVFTDLLKLQVELKEFENDILSHHNLRRMMIIQLNTLLNRDKDAEIIVDDNIKVPEFDYENPALLDSIIANNSMVKMNKTDIEAYRQQQQMNKKMGYPMIGLGMNYSVINKSDMSSSEMNGKDMVMPMLNLKLPIYRKKYKASVKEAEYLENSAKEQLTNTKNMLIMEFTGYQIALEDAKRGLSVYQDIVSLTQKSFDLLLVQYASSGADFDSIIRLQRQLVDYRLKIIQKQVDQLIAIAGIDKLLCKY